jgi:hypothetical protein
VRDLLSHSQIRITLDLYSHVTVTMQAIAAEAMGRLLGGRKYHLCDMLWAVAGQGADGRLRPVASTLSPAASTATAPAEAPQRSVPVGPVPAW